MVDLASPPVIIDNGSHTIKAGLSGHDRPTSCDTTVFGSAKFQMPLFKESYIGQEAIEKRGILKLSFPIEQGIITEWDRIE